MRDWRLWWRSLIWTSQHNPPQLVEGAMLGLGLIFCLVWLVLPGLPYLFLCLSYIIGAIVSILIREWVAPSFYTRQIRMAALFSLTLLLSVASFYLTRIGYLPSPSWGVNVL